MNRMFGNHGHRVNHNGGNGNRVERNNHEITSVDRPLSEIGQIRKVNFRLDAIVKNLASYSPRLKVTKEQLGEQMEKLKSIRQQVARNEAVLAVAMPGEVSATRVRDIESQLERASNNMRSWREMRVLNLSWSDYIGTIAMLLTAAQLIQGALKK